MFDKFVFCLIFTIALQTAILADPPNDKFIPPEPLIGIDSLSNIFHYPITLQKVFYEGAFRIKIIIDDEGKMESLQFDPLFKEQFSSMDSLMIRVTTPKLKSLEWKPAQYDGINVTSYLEIPVIFLLKNNSYGINMYYLDNWSYESGKSYIHKPILVENLKPTIVRCR